MPRFFNTAGPCKPDIHYMLPAERRIPELRREIERQGYFVLHAPRQSGKTTLLFSLAQTLTVSGGSAAVVLTAEAGQAFPDSVRAQAAILDVWRGTVGLGLPPELRPAPPCDTAESVFAYLACWAQNCPLPIVLFIDEIDALHGEALITLLRQLRSGYPHRPHGFPSSIGLIGLRDVRDYKLAAGGSDHLGTASPFNVKVESFTLRDFERDEIAELYGQHTADTEQVFADAAIDEAFRLSNGQPWIVNALARQCVDFIVPDGKTTIDAAHVRKAGDLLIRRMDTHLDSLAERLREPRVRRVIEPILAGEPLPDAAEDDLRFVADLGLVRVDAARGWSVANPLYREIVPRMLHHAASASLGFVTPVWLGADGRIDPSRLLDGFCSFWRQHGWEMLRSVPYGEVAAQLVMMAWLDRVANGGGRVDREYAIGHKRIDLCLHWKDQRLAFELKVWRSGRPDPLEAGLTQLDGYLAGLGLTTGWLILFDQRGAAIEGAESSEATTPSGRVVTVIRA